jgi:hypothetical protein
MDTFTYTTPPLAKKGPAWLNFRSAEVLEDSGLRYCIVGNPVARLLGSQVLVGDLFLAISDEQLEDARSTILKNRFTAIEQKKPLLRR